MAASDYERFSDGAHHAVVLTERVAREAGRDLAGPEDLLVALATVDPDAKHALVSAGTSAEVLRARVEQWLGAGAGDSGASGGSGGSSGGGGDRPVAQARFSPSLHRAVQRAVRLSVQERSDTVSGRHLLRGLLDGEDEVVWRVLISVGVDPGPLSSRPAPTRRSELRSVERARPRLARRLPVWR